MASGSMGSVVMMSLQSLVERGEKQQLREKLQEAKGKTGSTVKELFERNQQGHTPLDLAALLGRHEMLQLLLEHGAEVDGANKSGYTALHYSAAWGQQRCLTMLADKGADCFNLTRYKETPKDMAIRYGHPQCVELLTTYEEYTKLKHAVSDVRTTLSHSEKVSGKWNKDDKSKVTSLCNEKSDWLEKRAIKGTSVEDIQQQEEDFEQRMEPFLEKLAAAGV